jgi:hypothetical protein
LGRRSAGGSGAPVPGAGGASDLRQPDLKLRVLSGFARASTAEAEGMERSDGALISYGPFPPGESALPCFPCFLAGCGSEGVCRGGMVGKRWCGVWPAAVARRCSRFLLLLLPLVFLGVRWLPSSPPCLCGGGQASSELAAASRQSCQGVALRRLCRLVPSPRLGIHGCRAPSPAASSC